VSALLNSIQGAIQRRAYQYFEERDAEHGATWEIGSSAAPLVTFRDDQIDVWAELGEYRLSDLTLGIERFRIVVSGLIKTEVESKDRLQLRSVSVTTRAYLLNQPMVRWQVRSAATLLYRSGVASQLNACTALG
jgi:hypothetical protein